MAKNELYFSLCSPLLLQPLRNRAAAPLVGQLNPNSLGLYIAFQKLFIVLFALSCSALVIIRFI